MKIILYFNDTLKAIKFERKLRRLCETGLRPQIKCNQTVVISWYFHTIKTAEASKSFHQSIFSDLKDSRSPSIESTEISLDVFLMKLLTSFL